MVEKPNIIIFNVDQWRGDILGHLGNLAAVTPNLDKIDKNGDKNIFVKLFTLYCNSVHYNKINI